MTAIEKAVLIVGGQTILAKHLNIRPQAVQQWVASGRIPARRAIAIEKIVAGAVTRHELRPDLYPLEDTAAA